VAHQFETLSGQVIAGALAVHRELGPGFVESVYHAAMRVSLSHRGIPFQSQSLVNFSFEGIVVGRARLDLIVGNQIVVELKSVDRLHDIHFAQLRSYLRAAHIHVGLLLNFNAPTSKFDAYLNGEASASLVRFRAFVLLQLL
jgi:GxxExxY protein